MHFQIHALDSAPFQDYFSMSEAERRQHKATVFTADKSPCYPCRVSLEDARVGETVLAINYQHQAASNHYQASHAIYIRQNAAQSVPEINQVPELMKIRPISLRAFDQRNEIIDAVVTGGEEVGSEIHRLLSNDQVHRHRKNQHGER